VIAPIAVALLFPALLLGDTTIVLASTERDLTGDGKPEVLTLIGVGRSADDLKVTLSVGESGRELYRANVALLTRSEFDRKLRSVLRMSYEAWLKDVGRSFFAGAKFKPPETFLKQMGESMPGRIDDIPTVIARDGGFPSNAIRATAIWTEIQRSGMPIFEFSTGGDVVTAIAWSPTDRRFYRLLECC
jgi:hypothetical protein